MDFPIKHRGIGSPDGRVRAVSKKVFHGWAPLPSLDEAELDRTIEEAVNSVAWWPGEIIPLLIPSPPAAKAPLLEWLVREGFPEPEFAEGDALLLAEGSFFHHDGDDYAENFFCVQWLGNGDPWDLLFPESELRVPLLPGTVILFDPSNVHGVVYRGRDRFEQFGLGDQGVQPFTSLSLRMTPEYLRLFETGWHHAAPELDLSWSRHPFALCQETGQLTRLPSR